MSYVISAAWFFVYDLLITIKSNFSDKKEILKNINGEFRACELSAVLGQSGCGKTSLLNVLSGYKRKNVGGWIRINGDEDVKEIKNRSNYIMQNYTLHRFVTVREAMMFAVNLKLHGVSETCTNGKVSAQLHYNYFNYITCIGCCSRLHRYSITWGSRTDRIFTAVTSAAASKNDCQLL